jgi:hypothetical protein
MGVARVPFIGRSLVDEVDDDPRAGLDPVRGRAADVDGGGLDAPSRDASTYSNPNPSSAGSRARAIGGASAGSPRCPLAGQDAATQPRARTRVRRQCGAAAGSGIMKEGGGAESRCDGRADGFIGAGKS